MLSCRQFNFLKSLAMSRRILVIKMSSLGDLLHTLPAISDAVAAEPGLIVDWLCEEPFADIARLHPAVRNVIVSGRVRWKKEGLNGKNIKERIGLIRKLRSEHYDLIIDAQSRIKSARLGLLCRGTLVGPSAHTATDKETRFMYKRSFRVDISQGAIESYRQLFAQALGYNHSGLPQFGITKNQWPEASLSASNNLIFFHGTTWESKHWPENKWIDLLAIAKEAGEEVLLPWSSEAEKARAERLVESAAWGTILPRLSLWDLAGVISKCKGAVGLDTGLSHVAGAIGIPVVGIFGSTNSVLTGVKGALAKNLSAAIECAPCMLKVCPINATTPPCYETITPETVYSELEKLVAVNQ